MKNSETFKLAANGDREIVISRAFDAPRKLVFDALTKPELLKQWLTGPPGWTMPICEIDLRVGGKFRYVWRGPDGIEMGMGGVYREIKPPERLVGTEKFDEPWYPGEGLGKFELVEEDGWTVMTQTIQYESREARDMVLRSPMEGGVKSSYDTLEQLLAGERG
jgi:uncharacterized protein YndB with AHSA1/START domain